MMRAPRWARCGGVAALVSCALLAVAANSGASQPAATLDRVVIPNLGPGYAVTSQGPLDASQFASNAPDPSSAAGALSTLGNAISTLRPCRNR